MTSATELQPAFLLHSRPYRDTSALLELFSLNQGRVSVVARGIRSARSPLRGILQAFSPLLMSARGKGELLTLVQAEADGMPYFLQGNYLISGLYLNEILLYSLPRFDPHPDVYQAYTKALAVLAEHRDLEPTLRYFEWNLLQAMGYAPSLSYEGSQGLAIDAEAYYYFEPEQGLILCQANHVAALSGASVLALAARNLTTPQQMRDAKRLTRQALAPLLHHRSLKSRSLFLAK